MIASRRPPLRSRVRPRMPRLSPRLAVALIALVLVVGGIYLWLRDSSLVAVQKVRITGVSGPDAGRIRAALRTAALNMTTLDVQPDQLHTAVQPYPVVKRVDVSTSFPHAMTIHVVEKVPVAIVLAGGRRIPVSGDGTLLSSITATAALPTITLTVPPGGTRLTDGALQDVRVLGAAPYRILSRVASAAHDGAHGLTVRLRNGPSIYFGSAAGLRLKWSAAIAVLGDPSSAGAGYVDVTVPARPAAGAGTDTSAAPTTGTTTAPLAGTGTAPASPSVTVSTSG